MNQQAKAIFQQAQSLTAVEREELAELLLATVEQSPELDQVWAEEATRRWQAHQDSGDPAIDALAAIDAARAARRPQK